MLEELKEALEGAGFQTVTITENNGKKQLNEKLNESGDEIEVTASDENGDGFLDIKATINFDGAVAVTQFKVNIDDEDAVDAAIKILCHQLEYWQ